VLWLDASEARQTRNRALPFLHIELDRQTQDWPVKISPSMKVTTFKSLSAGELFMFQDWGAASLAIKTAQATKDGDALFVPLGPRFPENVPGPALLAWDLEKVVSFGETCTMLLSTDPVHWSDDRLDREPTWVAVCGEKTYFCINGGAGLQRFVPVYVELLTGKVIDQRPSGFATYTKHWEIALLSENDPPRSIIKSPLQPISPDCDGG
jgi:hypothetical protein